MADEQVLSEILARWEDAYAQGQTLTPEQLCTQHSHLLPQVREQIQCLLAFDPLLRTTAKHEWSDTAPVPTQHCEPRRLDESDSAAFAFRASRNMKGDRFTILKPHAAGGLGQVSLGRDNRLGRRVAVKEIRPERRHDLNLRQRFLVEAEITGQLEHPGIVPIYALEHDSNGQPFYVMRFLAGQTLAEAIAQFHSRRGGPPATIGPAKEGSLPAVDFRSLAFRNLLQRFVDVSQTIAYAHSQQVIHRDLKPANVMLGEYGETLVLDWGLAKRLGRTDDDPNVAQTPPGDVLPNDSNLTQAGQILGTLSFMSPEQAVGAEVGPPTDIYALGAILYNLLTGQAPHAGKPLAKALADLRTESPPSPKAKRSGVPSALEAICLKAMARSTEERYSSAMAVAREADRWLADEPVEAYADPWMDKARRWMKRHRTLAVSGATTLLLAALAAGGAALLVTQQNVALAEKNSELTEANIREAAARRQSDENFKRSLDAVDKYLKRVGESKELKARGLADLRRDLLGTAQDFYARFVAEHGDDPSLRVELANSQGNLGFLASESGSPRAAIDHYKKMQALYNQLTRGEPASVEHQKHLATAFFNLGYGYKAVGETNASEENYRQALRQYQQLVASHPQTIEFGRALAMTHNHLANLYQDTNRSEPALNSYRDAERILEALTAAHLNDVETTVLLANSYSDLALAYDHSQNATKAGEYYAKAVRLREQLVANDPAKLEFQRGAAVSYGNLGLAYLSGNQMEQAAESLQRAVTIYEALVRGRPWVTDYQAELAGSYSNLALLHANSQQLEKAREGFQKNVDIREQLAQQFPEVLDYAADLGGGYNNLGQIQSNSGNPNAAFETFTKAIAKLESVLAKEPNHDRGRRFLSFACFGRAKLLGHLSRHAEALQDWDRGLELTDPQGNPAIRVMRVETLARLGVYERFTGESKELAFIAKLPRSQYNLARANALASATAAQDSGLSAADRLRLSEQYAIRAIELLAQAKAGGQFNTSAELELLKQDIDFASLKRRDDYQKFLIELEM